MTTLLAIGLPTLLVLAYVLGGRDWLKGRPWAAGFFTRVERVEITLWRKSETILWARFQQLLGIVLAVLLGIGTLDLSPLFPLLPEKYKWLPSLLPLIITAAGKVAEWNRLQTTMPVELVEVPDKAPPDVAEAIEAVELINQEAIKVAKGHD